MLLGHRALRLSRMRLSTATMTKIVLPTDANSQGVAWGGWLLKTLDIVSSFGATNGNTTQQHSIQRTSVY